MSRIGKQPIEIRDGVTVTQKEETLEVKGPKGQLELRLHPLIKIEIKDKEILLSPKEMSKQGRSLWGLFRTLVDNMIIGVTEGYEKKLEFKGVGYKAQAQGDKLVLDVGFSHPVELKMPAGIAVSVEKNIITVSGISKEMVGQAAAKIRAVRKPEPYKGTGIAYEGEKIRRKVGKKAAAAE